MKPRSIGTLSVVSVLVCATCVVSAQQSKPIQPQKAPSPETEAEKKPNIIVFKLSGTPKPTQKPEPRKAPPHLRSLTNAERLEIARGVPGIPNLANAPVGPILTLSPDHRFDNLGFLLLGGPAQDWPVGYASYDAGVLLGNYDSRCQELEDNSREYVQVSFWAEANDVYIVDFLVAIFPAGTRDFQITVSGVNPSSNPVEVTGYGVTHLTTWPFLVTGTGTHDVRLQLKPIPNSSSPQPGWDPWYFYQVDVFKYVLAPTP